MLLASCRQKKIRVSGKHSKKVVPTIDQVNGCCPYVDTTTQVNSIKNAIEVTLQDENVYNGVVGVKSDLVTLTSTGTTVETTASFDTKLKETLDVTKTHLTSKKYKSQTIKFQVDGQGHVKVTGLPTEEKESK